MPQPAIDLSAHINQAIEKGHPADFPVTLRPVRFDDYGEFRDIPNRYAVVRTDKSIPLTVVSNRYRLIPHQQILDVVERALEPLDLGPVPRGIYVDRRGARMRAVFKFPSLATAVLGKDEVCPCLKIQNTYDAQSRITVHIGAFRFVCTNLAVGGGGVFAGGFMSVHAGEIRIEEIGKQLVSYLTGFDAIVELYRAWAERTIISDQLEEILAEFPKRAAVAIRERSGSGGATTVYAAYNAATQFATHEMKSFRGAFELLGRINRAFQARFAPEVS